MTFRPASAPLDFASPLPPIAGRNVASFIAPLTRCALLSPAWQAASCQRLCVQLQYFAREIQATADQHTGGSVARQPAQRSDHVRPGSGSAIRGFDDRLDRTRVVLPGLGDRPQGGCNRNKWPKEFASVLRLLHADHKMYRPIRPCPQMLAECLTGAWIVPTVQP